jgi:undecaprenyl-diphosphatase
MKKWYNNLHNRLTRLAETKWGPWVLFISAFADASFFPLPATTIFLILLLLDSKRVLRYLFFIVFGTMAGAMAGYLFGHFAWLKPGGEFSGVAQFVFDNVPGFSVGVYDKVHVLFLKWDFWILGLAAATPLPFGILSITSGIFSINVFLFLIAILVSQGIKFAFIAYVAVKIGLRFRIPDFRRIKELKWKPVAIISSVSVLVLFVVIRIF